MDDACLTFWALLLLCNRRKAIAEKCAWGLGTLSAAAASGHKDVYEFVLEVRAPACVQLQTKEAVGTLTSTCA